MHHLILLRYIASVRSLSFLVRNASPDSIAYHECAHAVEQLMIDANSAYTYPFERTIAWNKCTEAKSIVSEACKNIKKHHMEKVRRMQS